MEIIATIITHVKYYSTWDKYTVSTLQGLKPYRKIHNPLDGDLRLVPSTGN